MTPKEVVEQFARQAENFCWGADHVHYKGADEILLSLVEKAVVAERQRWIEFVTRERDAYRAAEPDIIDPAFVLSLLLQRVPVEIPGPNPPADW